MSDKAKEFFDNYDFSETINKDDLVISETDIIELMQSYADQHLKDVLEVSEEIIGEAAFHKHKTQVNTLDKRYGFICGVKWLLNHLKQQIKSKH